MDRQAFLTLTTSSQWVLFLAIGLIIYSWIEKKKIIMQLGQGAFVLLGIFALWIILGDRIIIPEMTEEYVVPVEAKALSYFSGLVVTGALGLVALILGKFNLSWGKYANMILVPVGLALFFMVYQLQRIP